MGKNRDKTKTKGNGGVVAKQKKKYVKPSSEVAQKIKTDSNGGIGMNRAARRKKLREEGILVTTTAVAQNQQLQGEKVFACLHPNCNETFEVWQQVRNHMNKCKTAADGEQRFEGKPNIKESRKKGNQLLIQGKATKKEYSPLPT